jgi:hypothetical protein
MVMTAGKVRHSVVNHRIVLKPSMGRFIIRTRGVNRTSAKVLERNEMFRKVAPEMVLACRGQPWPVFVACLKKQARAKELGAGTSKTLDYRKRFWKHKEEKIQE